MKVKRKIKRKINSRQTHPCDPLLTLSAGGSAAVVVALGAVYRALFLEEASLVQKHFTLTAGELLGVPGPTQCYHVATSKHTNRHTDTQTHRHTHTHKCFTHLFSPNTFSLHSNGVTKKAVLGSTAGYSTKKGLGSI